LTAYVFRNIHSRILSGAFGSIAVDVAVIKADILQKILLRRILEVFNEDLAYGGGNKLLFLDIVVQGRGNIFGAEVDTDRYSI
jgi:hypothetical protein